MPRVPRVAAPGRSRTALARRPGRRLVREGTRRARRLAL